MTGLLVFAKHGVYDDLTTTPGFRENGVAVRLEEREVQGTGAQGLKIFRTFGWT